MNITYMKQRNDDVFVYEVAGDVLTVNGVAYDFSPLAEGDFLPLSAVTEGGAIAPWLASDVTRRSGVITLTAIQPCTYEEFLS